mmetsp:Transcript_46895/g.97764  ORF Transcript_46895/g.97764 Transcript_46895/m.97764 type:complete len:111 (-) Transcript_46895:78-410(-)
MLSVAITFRFCCPQGAMVCELPIYPHPLVQTNTNLSFFAPSARGSNHFSPLPRQVLDLGPEACEGLCSRPPASVCALAGSNQMAQRLAAALSSALPQDLAAAAQLEDIAA